MTRTERVLGVLLLLLFLAVTVPFLPDTLHLRFFVGAGRPITLIEYIQNALLSLMGI